MRKQKKIQCRRATPKIISEDSWWANQAELAMKEGTIGQEESEKKLAQWLNAKD
ncbi:MAG: hypothetical protein HQ462_00120 [Deltaproteobacteria bacterium]|nr:hypothetical protein [Deltaproteobacteria bacterium]